MKLNGVFKIFRGLQTPFYENRHLNTPAQKGGSCSLNYRPVQYTPVPSASPTPVLEDVLFSRPWQSARMKITSDIFEAYLKCSTKCFLTSVGEGKTGNAYADWFHAQNELYRNKGVEYLLEGSARDGCVSRPSSEDAKTAKWRLATDFIVQTPQLESVIHAVERVPPEGRGKVAQFIPTRFIFTNKLTRDDKLLLAFDAFVLSEMSGREVGFGRIIHGDNHATAKIKTSSLKNRVKKLVEKIVELTSGDSPPDLVLNRHCGECEFQDRCRQKAVEKDDLSLLTSLNVKERKKLHGKGGKFQDSCRILLTSHLS